MTKLAKGWFGNTNSASSFPRTDCDPVYPLTRESDLSSNSAKLAVSRLTALESKPPSPIIISHSAAFRRVHRKSGGRSLQNGNKKFRTMAAAKAGGCGQWRWHAAIDGELKGKRPMAGEGFTSRSGLARPISHSLKVAFASWEPHPEMTLLKHQQAISNHLQPRH